MKRNSSIPFVAMLLGLLGLIVAAVFELPRWVDVRSNEPVPSPTVFFTDSQTVTVDARTLLGAQTPIEWGPTREDEIVWTSDAELQAKATEFKWKRFKDWMTGR